MSKARHALESLQMKIRMIRIQKQQSHLQTSLTGGLTNHAVSHSVSTHRCFTNISTSRPARRTSISSSSDPFGDVTNLSIVIPHSDKAGKHDGKLEGEGGGEVLPVNPQRPSCSTRALIDSGTISGWYIGRRVQIRVCSTSGGTVGGNLDQRDFGPDVDVVNRTGVWPVVLYDAD